ncbi:penicillin-binding protein activator LpoB [Xenorhabdus sp. DI]|uniref:penicillin-binding protein activator LpoB n=1 Tax=Xenorhabdus doucetiae TaxID=351671 RepID=UPI0019A5A79E|nr:MULTISPECIES: penicillin-binding protein activator LpoB [unclassified Xenorhabdus]MBD2783596.1 penicillin-binding protein activator LpoB [Xenorhabdus sp. 3]MBD2789731.1 penicillin-binding protein activator LpoB [Xenorhabdus sp. DI]
MKRILFVMLSAILLASCVAPEIQQPAPVTPAEPEKKPEPSVRPSEKVPQPPKIQSIDWQSIVQPLVDQMVNAHGVEAGKVLLVDSVKNNTNGSLRTLKATDALMSAISNKQAFQVVPKSLVHVARQALGLSAEDSLGLRSKSIGLARYLNADYVLYSVVANNQGQRDLEMQLMLVKTGEILWSGCGDVN